MKQTAIVIISIFWFFASANSQAKFKVINAITKQPLKDIYCNIIKDGDTWVDIGNTNNKGIFTPKEFLDSNSSYQLWIFAKGYKSFKKDVSLFSEKISTVAIYPEKESFKKNPNFVYSSCASIGFGHYQPKTPESLNDLPDSIRGKLIEHLISRLGNWFYSKLKLGGGQIVNLDRLYKVEGDAKNYKWIPYNYYLCFSFQDTAKGIGRYAAQIVLDKYGNVVNEIELPDISLNPEKATILSLKSASAIAKKNGFTPTTANTSLEFNTAAGSLVWCFKRMANDNGLTFSMEELNVDAHNGSVLGTNKGNGIR